MLRIQILIKQFIMVALIFSMVSFPKIVNADSSTLELGILDFPPFYIVKNENTIEGSKTDVLRMVLNHAEIKFTEKGYPPKRLYKNIAEGKTNIWMGVKGVPVYDDKVFYSEKPIDSIEIRVYTRADMEPPITKEALQGKKVITIMGYSYGGMITFLQNPENNIQTDPSNTHEIAIKKLIRKRADYLLDYKTPAESAIAKIGVSNLKHSSLVKLNLHFIIPKSTPNADVILQKMETSYGELLSEGKI